ARFHRKRRKKPPGSPNPPPEKGPSGGSEFDAKGGSGFSANQQLAFLPWEKLPNGLLGLLLIGIGASSLWDSPFWSRHGLIGLGSLIAGGLMVGFAIRKLLVEPRPDSDVADQK
ncbi:hypothetical protein, partial [Silvimonas iriomotensis]|uniref:hypothetical protein n=1 Tax=Silvimonas iriomotensis TaxID=449662 RepID=UPI001E4A096B